MWMQSLSNYCIVKVNRYFSKRMTCHYFCCRSLMRDAEVSKNRTRLPLDNKKQNTFVSENNLESIKVP